jgi:DNA-binding response OmpR family regulator
MSRAHMGPIDLLLTDVVMPGMSGRDLAREIRATRPSTAIVYMSGYTDEAVVRHGMLEPGTEFLEKPFAPAAVARRIRELLDRAIGA